MAWDRVSGNRTLLDRELAHLTPARPSICETRHVTTMLGMVEAGIGIAAVPAMSMPAGEHSVLRAVPLTDPGGHAYGRPDPPQRPYSVLQRRAELEKLIIEQYPSG